MKGKGDSRCEGWRGAAQHAAESERDGTVDWFCCHLSRSRSMNSSSRSAYTRLSLAASSVTRLAEKYNFASRRRRLYIAPPETVCHGLPAPAVDHRMSVERLT